MKYSLPPIIDHKRRILIIGTMPGEQSIALQQYYANRGNRFWKLLYDVFDKPFSTDYDKRLQVLADHQIALWNVLASCDRQGSSDHRIKNEIANPLPDFFKKWPNIKYVFFESLGAQKYFRKFFAELPQHHYQVLPSTSGLYAAKSYEQKLDEWRVLASIK